MTKTENSANIIMPLDVTVKEEPSKEGEHDEQDHGTASSEASEDDIDESSNDDESDTSSSEISTSDSEDEDSISLDGESSVEPEDEPDKMGNQESLPAYSIPTNSNTPRKRKRDDSTNGVADDTPHSDLRRRVADFLPRIQAANARIDNANAQSDVGIKITSLDEDAGDEDEVYDEDEGSETGQPYVEMNVGTGVLSPKAANGESNEVRTRIEDDEASDTKTEILDGHVLETLMGKRKSNTHAKKLVEIQEI